MLAMALRACAVATVRGPARRGGGRSGRARRVRGEVARTLAASAEDFLAASETGAAPRSAAWRLYSALLLRGGLLGGNARSGNVDGDGDGDGDGEVSLGIDR
eukprot:COSAG02_NODE_2386_length_8989_cov_6.465917_8_plen_102_part_00